jgi:hypothetical protein
MNVQIYDRKLLASCLVLLLVFLTGCASREHMRPDFGEKTKTYFAKQHVHQEASTKPPMGLDSEEAAIVQSTYRKNLGKQSGAATKDPGAKVLLLQKDQKDDSD